MNKRIIALIMLVAFFAVALTGCSMGGNKVGKVDMNKIMNESQFAKDIKTELQNKEKALTADLEKDQKTMSEADFQKKMQAAQADFMKSNQDAKAKFDAAIKSAIEKVRKDKSVDVVMYSDSIAEGGVDITDEVIKAMPAAAPVTDAAAPAAPAATPEKK